MSIYNATVPQYTKMLRNLSAWLDKAQATAEAGKYDVSVLLNSRLAPDQFHLIRQVQACCDTSKFAVSRLADVQAPSHPDTETTFDELKARIDATIAFIETVSEDALNSSADRTIALPWAKGMGSKGREYLNAFAIPNLYFHLSMVYAILRHNGVALGKMDFLGSVDIFPLE